MEGNTKDNNEHSGIRWRRAAWAAATLILLMPLIVMQITGGVDWTVGDFVFAGVLLFGSLGTYEIAARMTRNTTYRTAAGLALVAGFLLIWANAAVGITDSFADVMYLGVVAVGFIGALFARFDPRGMARAMFATALAQGLVGVIAMIAGVVPAYNSAYEILGITGGFVVLWIGSGLLFRRVAREESEGGTASSPFSSRAKGKQKGHGRSV